MDSWLRPLARRARLNGVCILAIRLRASQLISINLSLLKNNNYDNNNKRAYLLRLL